MDNQPRQQILPGLDKHAPVQPNEMWGLRQSRNPHTFTKTVYEYSFTNTTNSLPDANTRHSSTV